jgi:phosphoribosylamine-glycine ligase
LTVVAAQQDLPAARTRAYAAAKAISFEGCYLRRDIGADDWSA